MTTEKHSVPPSKQNPAPAALSEQGKLWDWDERVTEFYITCNGQTLFRVHDEWTARTCVKEHNSALSGEALEERETKSSEEKEAAADDVSAVLQKALNVLSSLAITYRINPQSGNYYLCRICESEHPETSSAPMPHHATCLIWIITKLLSSHSNAVLPHPVSKDSATVAQSMDVIGQENEENEAPVAQDHSSLLGQTEGLRIISHERQRQLSVKGWTLEHDDSHTRAQILLAALAYGWAAKRQLTFNSEIPPQPIDWVWGENWWKPSKDPIRNLAKAGALIAAEIDRLLRLEERKAQSDPKGSKRSNATGVAHKESASPPSLVSSTTEEQKDLGEPGDVEPKSATGQMALELLRVAVCPECDGSGAKQVQTQSRQYVTREMAHDAGDLSMEGSLYSDDEFETQQCRWCYERNQCLSEKGTESVSAAGVSPQNLPAPPVSEQSNGPGQVEPPEVIYLQYHGDGNPDDEGTVRDCDVTWCRDKIFEHDLEYVRAWRSVPDPGASESSPAIRALNDLAHTPEGVKVGLSPWLEHPFRLLSWLDMEKFSAESFHLIIQRLAEMQSAAYYHTNDAFARVSSEAVDRIKVLLLPVVRTQCEKIGLRYSIKEIDRIASEITSPTLTNRQLQVAMTSILNRIRDELEGTLFVWVAPECAGYFEYPSDTDKFDSDQKALAGFIRDRFQKAVNEIDEARTCYAVGRWTASVFHLMRACEVGIKSVYKTLGIASPKLSDSWGQMLKPMDEQLQKKPADRSGAWAAEPLFFDHITNDIRAVKRAWRDTTMHVESTYDQSGALKALNAVTSLFTHLAKRLDQDGNLLPEP